MYLRPGMFLAIASWLSSTCCAVTLGPKQYHEHHPVGGAAPRIGGSACGPSEREGASESERGWGPASSGRWFSARRRPTPSSSDPRSLPLEAANSSSVQRSPGASVSSSVSTTACSDDGRT